MVVSTGVGWVKSSDGRVVTSRGRIWAGDGVSGGVRYMVGGESGKRGLTMARKIREKYEHDERNSVILQKIEFFEKCGKE